MSTGHEIEVLLADWLQVQASEQQPPGFHEEAMDRIRAARLRPAWQVAMRGHSMSWMAAGPHRPTRGLGRVVVVGLLIALLASLAVLVGSQPDIRPPRPPALEDQGVFTPAGAMSVPRELGWWNFTATLLLDGRVLVVGGASPSPHRAPIWTAEIWDPGTATVQETGSLSDARGGHTATLLPDGRVLVAGGVGYDGGGRRGEGTAADDGLRGPLASAEIWDPRTGDFGPTGSLAHPRERFVASLLPDGRVLIEGGSYTDVTDDGTVRFPPPEAWDPATGLFAAVDPDDPILAGRAGVAPTPPAVRPQPMDGAGTLALADGRVLIVGGDTGQFSPELGGVLRAAAEIWDPETGSLSPAGTLHEARTYPAMLLLADGRVLVIGGGGPEFPDAVVGECRTPSGRMRRCNKPNVLASAELWAPVAAADSQTGP